MKQPEKPLAVFDIDGTLIRWQLYHAVADMFVKLGYTDPETYQSVKNARMEWKRRTGEEAFQAYELKLVEVYTEVLKTLTHEQLELAAQKVYDEYKDQVYTYTRDLIKELKAKGYLLFAISGSQVEIVKLLADYYGFNDYLGSVYERSENGFTGKLTSYRHNKHIHVAKLAKKHGATTKGSVAVGDSKGDITMLEAIEQPIAFNPEKKLFDAAKENFWPIVIERKNVVYKLEPRGGKYILA